MSKIYTKKGDKGKTSLYDGSRVYKCDKRICVLGTFDELIAHIGELVVLVDENDRLQLQKIQVILSDISSIIATPKGNKSLPMNTVDEKYISELERGIDRFMSETPPLKDFVLPGATISNAKAHVCRAVTRRLEREIIESELVEGSIIKYVNRLSDYFFAYSRKLCDGKERLVKEVRGIDG